MSTIAAISTPNAVGGISVIRISGENSIEVAEKIFKSTSGKKTAEMYGYTCAHGVVVDRDNSFVDEVILSVFKSPKSYTGEDVVEISCHGGIYITKKVLRLVFENGAAPAEAGEFTKRAFLNGKMSLTQAEAVIDLISASGQSELKYAIALKDGAIFRRIDKIKSEIISVLGDLAAWADFPEDDIPEVDPVNLLKRLKNIYDALVKTNKTYDYGRIIREGINTVIAGKPNVGKSTLMNCLSGFERSIVTDIAGTTRDVVEETVQLGEIKLRLSDTAGIRNTDDLVENIGVNLAFRRIDEADLVLALFDNSEEFTDEDIQLIEKLVNSNAIAIINKSDEKSVLDRRLIDENFKYMVEISAKNNDGIDKLVEAVNEMFVREDIDAEKGIIANERQKNCIVKAEKLVGDSINALEQGELLDAITVILDEAAGFLLELTGEKVSETVVDEVFSRFCIGK